MQEADTKLSIVITTKDRFGALERCIESVAASTIDMQWELIIVDDCSTDDTGGLNEDDIRDRFALNRVTVYHASKSLKMVKARNKGAELSRGRFILFIDDDNVTDRRMARELVSCAEAGDSVGIVGPAMYMLASGEKYLDFQTINMFTLRTRLRVVDPGTPTQATHESDGVPNVFLVKREVFERAGYFDEQLIQSFTEPDFSFNARRYGFTTVTCPRAKTFHDIDLADRGRHMGSIPAKAYCLIRNRFVIARRYGRPLQLLVFLAVFSWIWPILYSLIAVRDRNPGRIPYYLAGFVDGFYYALTKKFRTRGFI